MAVVEAHDVAVRSAQAGVLLVLPVEVVAYGLEEVLLVFGGPVLGIADDPVQLAGLIVEVDDGVFVAAGNGDGFILLEVPDSVAVEPVAGALGTGTRALLGQNVLEIPGPEGHAGLAVKQDDEVFHGIGVEVLGQGKDVAVGHFHHVVVVVAGHTVFLVDLAHEAELDEAGVIVRHVAETVRTGQDVAVLKTLDVKHGVDSQEPADVAFEVIAHGEVLAGGGQEHPVGAEVVEGSHDVAAAADIGRQFLAADEEVPGLTGGEGHGHLRVHAFVEAEDRDGMLGFILLEGLHDVVALELLAVHGQRDAAGLIGHEEDKSAEGVDEVGVDQNSGVLKGGLILPELLEEALFGLVLGGNEAFLSDVGDGVYHGFSPCRRKDAYFTIFSISLTMTGFCLRPSRRLTSLPSTIKSSVGKPFTPQRSLSSLFSLNSIWQMRRSGMLFSMSLRTKASILHGPQVLE